MRWLLRDYHNDDLESVVRLCDATSAVQAAARGVLRVIGAALSSVSGERGWIIRIALTDSWR